MTNNLHSLVSLRAIAQEDGYIPGEALSAIETVVTFVLIPIALFFVIALLSWVSTRERKKKKSSSITSIE
jgi:large-conductance mechanosensitive channel